MPEPRSYTTLAQSLGAVIENESSLIANLANASALIHEAFQWHWVGFYLVDADQKTLVLGPFQGPVACTRIPYNQGVCGRAWGLKKTLRVPNVHEFEGHIACSPHSQSEIVIPLFQKNGDCWGVLDIDSAQLDDFSEADQEGLESLARIIEHRHPQVSS